MSFDRKAILRGSLVATVILIVGALAFAQNQASTTASPSNKELRIINAVGNAVVAVPTTGCANITCPATDTCTYVTLTGTAKGFNRFGGSLGNSQMIACISTDTSSILPNGNDSTSCSPSSGTVVLAGSTSTVTLSMAGQTCTIPGTTASDIQVFNETWAVSTSTDAKVGRGAGSFNAFANTVSGDGSFNVAGNFSVASATTGPSSSPTSTASSTASASPSASASATPSASASATP
jgi:hypothetical protein